MPVYVGINGIRKKLKEWPVGIGGIKKQQKEVWTSENGVKKKIFTKDEIVTVTYSGSSSLENGYTQSNIVIEDKTYYGTPGGSIKIKKGTPIKVTASIGASGVTGHYIEFNGSRVGKNVTTTRKEYTFSCLSDVSITLNTSLKVTDTGYFVNYGWAIIEGGT